MAQHGLPIQKKKKQLFTLGFAFWALTLSASTRVSIFRAYHQAKRTLRTKRCQIYLRIC